MLIILIWLSLLVLPQEQAPSTYISPDIPNITVDVSDPALDKHKGQLFYSGNLFSGYLEEHFSGGVIKSRVPFFNGKKESWEQTWHPTGMLQSERLYERGKKVGIHVGFWENGTKQYEYHFKQGLYHGPFLEWYADSKPMTQFFFEDGEENGSQKSWNSDGSPKANFVTKNGRRYGLIGVKRCQ